jgi:hypothetical protein
MIEQAMLRRAWAKGFTAGVLSVMLILALVVVWS